MILLVKNLFQKSNSAVINLWENIYLNKELCYWSSVGVNVCRLLNLLISVAFHNSKQPGLCAS